MLYQSGDYVCPADLPRPIVCRVRDVESLSVGRDVSQILKLEPLNGPWPPGTLLIRLDAAVVPAPARTSWHGRAAQRYARRAGRRLRSPSASCVIAAGRPPTLVSRRRRRR